MKSWGINTQKLLIYIMDLTNHQNHYCMIDDSKYTIILYSGLSTKTIIIIQSGNWQGDG